MKTQFDYNSQTYSIDLTPSGKNYRLLLGDKMVAVEVLRADDGRLDLLIDGKVVSAMVSLEGTKCWVTLNGQTLLLTKSSGVNKSGGHAAGALVAPMPGQVRAVQVAEGQAVTKGQTLVVVEAMKMEIKITAPGDGVVKGLFVKVGQTVEREQKLLEISAD